MKLIAGILLFVLYGAVYAFGLLDGAVNERGTWMRCEDKVFESGKVVIKKTCEIKQ